MRIAEQFLMREQRAFGLFPLTWIEHFQDAVGMDEVVAAARQERPTFDPCG